MDYSCSFGGGNELWSLHPHVDLSSMGFMLKSDYLSVNHPVYEVWPNGKCKHDITFTVHSAWCTITNLRSILYGPNTKLWSQPIRFTKFEVLVILIGQFESMDNKPGFTLVGMYSSLSMVLFPLNHCSLRFWYTVFSLMSIIIIGISCMHAQLASYTEHEALP